MSNSLDPDQARQFVGPDLGPNCLPRLSADDTGRQRVKTWSAEKMDWNSNPQNILQMYLKGIIENVTCPGCCGFRQYVSVWVGYIG